MKTDNKIWLTLVSGMLFAGCADRDIDVYNVEKPASMAQYEYVNAYGNLKDYVSKRAGVNPDFKLGCGVSAPDYNKYGMVYRITNANFDQITAGNAMKYASIVGDNGEMNFSTVVSFVAAAEAAGIEIYGHTLCWHEQQNVKWLNSLIADRELEVDPDQKNVIEDAVKDFKNDAKFPFYVMGYEPQIINGILTVPEYPGDWYQFFIMDGLSTVPGRTYTVTARVRGSKEGSLNVQFGNWGATVEKQMGFTDEWKECSVTFDGGVTTESSFVVFQPGTYDGKLEIEWIKLTHSEAPSVEMETEINVKTYQDGPFPFYAMGCEPPVINGCIHFVPTGDWSQFFILPGGENKLTEGDYVIYLDITSSKDASGIQLTMQNGWGEGSQAISVPVGLSEGPNNVRLSLSGVTGGDYDVILKPQTCDATLDVRSVKVCKVEKLNKLPLSPEEKAEVLTAEMERWIKGMMEATEGKVKAWDVVNEAISGGPWGQRYDLQHAATMDDPSNKFFWQDYLGDNFVRVPVKFARQYFAENGGNPDDLKLFINDYNLESDWDDNQKLKSLIQWIEQWESDGETRIDGIGSQMHITCYMNPETQASKEAHVVKMFELMAASGKLVRITELDMGLCDENGNSVKTQDVTFEQHQAMAAYYKFVIDKYFEIIPVAQQYGICQWAQTDSPENSGWRAGEPIGLWDLNFNRKPTYAGFADGLAGEQ